MIFAALAWNPHAFAAEFMYVQVHTLNVYVFVRVPCFLLFGCVDEIYSTHLLALNLFNAPWLSQPGHLGIAKTYVSACPWLLLCVCPGCLQHFRDLSYIYRCPCFLSVCPCVFDLYIYVHGFYSTSRF